MANGKKKNHNGSFSSTPLWFSFFYQELLNAKN